MHQKITRPLLAGGLLIAACIGATSEAASADDTGSPNPIRVSSVRLNPVRVSYFKNFGTGYCLDGWWRRGGYLQPCNNGVFQRFIWNTTPGARTPIRSVGERKDGKKWCLAAFGSSVTMQECVPGRSSQEWHISYPAGSRYPFIRSWYLNKCMSHRPPFVQQGKLGLEPCWSGYGDRRWRVLFI